MTNKKYFFYFKLILMILLVLITWSLFWWVNAPIYQLENKTSNPTALEREKAKKKLNTKLRTIHLELTAKENSTQIINDYIIFDVFPRGAKIKQNYLSNGSRAEIKREGNRQYVYNNDGKVTSLQYYNPDGTNANQCHLIYNYAGQIIDKKCYQSDGIQARSYKYTYNLLGQIMVKQENNPQNSNNFKYNYSYNELGQLTHVQQYWPDGVTGIKTLYDYQLDDDDKFFFFFNF
ncbi:hypothetical protein [Candidatus Phytoplasma solani]|uniref:hypothetical protein n=1 Tax=Candidatus Phytoplasma solani TaxID=69896 RepID=UPI00358E6F4F